MTANPSPTASSGSLYLGVEGDTTLNHLSSFAAHSFTSFEEAVEATLRLITRQTGLQRSFLARVSLETGQHEILASYDEQDGTSRPLSVSPLAQTYCSLVAGEAKPAPLPVENTRTDARLVDHPARQAFPDIGSYLGAPVVLRDGSLFGTLCATDPAPHSIPSDKVELLVILARLLSTEIDHERELAELRRLYDLRSNFVHIVSHEFRTALTGIQGFSELLRDADLTPAEVREYANDINTDAQRLARMINEMLNLERAARQSGQSSSGM